MRTYSSTSASPAAASPSSFANSICRTRTPDAPTGSSCERRLRWGSENEAAYRASIWEMWNHRSVCSRAVVIGPEYFGFLKSCGVGSISCNSPGAGAPGLLVF